MKLLFKIIYTILFCLPCLAQDKMVDYHNMIQPSVTTWDDTCIKKLSTEEIIVLTDMLLLSYQVVQASVTMSQARLVIQSDLFNIITLSINDTFDVRMQAENNDLTIIKNAVLDIEQAQEQIKSACKTLTNFGPLLINIDPIVIQLFIFNLKTIILNWAKQQHSTMDDFQTVQEEFSSTAHLFKDVKTIFKTIITTDPIEHNQLLHGTNSLTNMYKKIEDTIANLTIIRQESLANFNIILTLFFKLHYQALYNHLPNNNLPDPEAVFILA